MESKWRKLKLALGFKKTSIHLPKTTDQPSSSISDRLSSASGAASGRRPSTPTPSSSGLRLSSSSSSSYKVCIFFNESQFSSFFTA